VNILIVGGGSFVGRHLSAMIDKNENNVFIGTTSSVNHEHDSGSNLFNIHLNLLDKSTVYDSLDLIQPEIIVHLASIRNETATYSGEIFDVNVSGLQTLFQACNGLKIQPHVVFTSAMGIYDYTNPLYVPVDEHHPAKPHDLYGLTKLLGETICEFHSGNRIRSTVLRIPGIYGPHKNQGLIYSLLKRSNKTKSITIPSAHTVRDFIHIDDVVRSIIATFTYDSSSLFNIFNIGSGTGISLKQIVNYADDITTNTIDISYDNLQSPSEFFMDISKARKMLGYKPTTIAEGMTLFWNYLNEK
jgi:UDP-glucose 4-epimerase